ncbi:hypothetical protein BDP55DRAFT_636290 [Colletotrichum godetiae]|uniref:Uncharacterized protein n=1 Tax=Colletotrichum godetiae TaxID=1209918 RepID=A0AAJ0ER33_9PEZI|nr:uncharacterized protein BDP55DRAFT_636290 [Colletotrichum godetiae]KAK1660137.1 hypothetical protein BDP55DRAFT_636290 [Colletotrichum godetiae]
MSCSQTRKTTSQLKRKDFDIWGLCTDICSDLIYTVAARNPTEARRERLSVPAMCIQWIASANCTGTVDGNTPQNGCKGAHVAVTILTLSAGDQETVNAPCEVCGADEDPEQMMLLRIFDDAFAAEWVVAFGESHYAKCPEGEWHNAEKERDFRAKDGLFHGRWPMGAVTKNRRGESIQIRFLGQLVPLVPLQPSISRTRSLFCPPKPVKVLTNVIQNLVVGNAAAWNNRMRSNLPRHEIPANL